MTTLGKSSNSARPTTRQGRHRLAGRVLGGWLCLAMLVGSGCAPTRIDTTYGKRRGVSGGSSVNGTAVLAQMFQSAGHRVNSWRRLSPRLHEHDTIVWAPDNYRPPTDEQRLFLERWLWEASGRTLVYIGRDYDAAVEYWRGVLSQAPPEQTLDVARQLAMRQSEIAFDQSSLPREDPCDWFTIERGSPRRELRRVEGPWSEGLASDNLQIASGERFVRPSDEQVAQWLAREETDWDDPPNFESLLHAGQEPLVTRITMADWGGSQILVVTNGSFLLNLPLVNHEHRKLAGRLVSACGSPGKVVFLESDADGPAVHDTDLDASGPTGFEIFTIWPIGVVAIHLTLLGITVCLALFPIFGRPREPHEDLPADFGKHVQALGELLEATHDEQYALHRIQAYHDTVRRDVGVGHASTSRNETKPI